VCGHEESEGSIMRFASPDDEDETTKTERIARHRAEARLHKWYSDTMTLRAVTFPIYAAERWPAQINGSGSRGDALTDLTIVHFETEDADLFDVRPRIEVTTSTEEPYHAEIAIARQKLEHWVHDDVDHPTRRTSPTPRSPWGSAPSIAAGVPPRSSPPAPNSSPSTAPPNPSSR
jgi:hypothetical protein